MKIVVVSDIHGGFLEFEKIIEQEPFDKLVVLGIYFLMAFMEVILNLGVFLLNLI